jgi:hypothetical protein
MSRGTGREDGDDAPQDGELLPQSKVLEHQAGPWAHERPERSEDGDHESSLTVCADDVTAESRLIFR